MKTKVMFLCTGNSCRSQMAEGWARQLLGDSMEPFSAGIEAQGLAIASVLPYVECWNWRMEVLAIGMGRVRSLSAKR